MDSGLILTTALESRLNVRTITVKSSTKNMNIYTVLSIPYTTTLLLNEKTKVKSNGLYGYHRNCSYLFYHVFD